MDLKEKEDVLNKIWSVASDERNESPGASIEDLDHD